MSYYLRFNINYSNEVSIFESINVLCECFHMKSYNIQLI